MRTTFLIFAVAAITILVGAVRADKRFKSTGVKVLVENGYYTADVYYKYDESGKNKHYLRYDYKTPTTMIDLIDYSEGIRSKVCTKCEAGYYPYSAPALFKQDGDIATGETEGECKEYTPAVTYAMSSIWYKDDGTLCKATLADGKTLVFSNINTTFNDDTLFNLEGKQCPAPICKRVMDLVFVIDNSGSVGSSNWETVKKFIINVTNSFDIGTDATMIGVVSYDYSASKIIDLSGDKNAIINAVTGAKYVGGTTCTGCGMDLGMKLMNSTSDARNTLDPEKVMMVVTDGENNELDNKYFCRSYVSTCTTPGSKCIKYQCNGPTKTVTTPVCKRYENTTQCLKNKCQNCDKQGQCLRNNTNCVKRSTTNCLRRSTTYCMGNPSRYCCSIRNGVLSNNRYCGRCDCTEYRCDEYACEQYGCDVYDCDSCLSYSNECLIYKQTCAEYETIEQCTTDEACVEYECIGGSISCNETGLGANSLLSGAISRTRTPWALYPASKRLPIVIAIGVGSVNNYELKGIASTLEGKQLVYTVKDFSALSTIINDLVDETCTKQTDNLELCSDDCHGFCGCEKKCYCPTCDTPTGTCYTIGCTTDGTTSTGCVATHETCPNTNLCLTKTADNNTAGCCVTKNVDCAPKPATKCILYSCEADKGCLYSDVVCTPPSPCYNSTGCDPVTGCGYIDACPDISLCKLKSCDVLSSTAHRCNYVDKCTSSDPCMLPVCDEATGACSLVPKVCTPKNSCFTSRCYQGRCIEELNTTRSTECANITNSSCEEGYCDEETGECNIRDTGITANCDACNHNNTLDCPGQNNKCFTYKCAPVDNETDATQCIADVDLCPPSTDPCIFKTCDPVAGCVSHNASCPKPSDPCHFVQCVPDPTNSSTHKCKITNNFAVHETDDVCWEPFCNEFGLPDKRTRCPHKPCHTFVGCDVGADSKANCSYKPIVCNSTRCTYSFCDEETDQCNTIDNSSGCDPHNPCMSWECSESFGCLKEPIVCDDHDKCTEDKCVPINETSDETSGSSGTFSSSSYVCVFTKTCTTDKFCERANCSNATGKCTKTEYTCEDMDKNAIDNCHMYQCDEESRSCKVVLLPSAFLDVCGSCIKTYGTNATLNITAAKTACIGGMKATDFAATIAGATVAAIVIACIIAAVAIGVASAIGTRELVKRAKKNADVGTNSNPLYEDNDKESVNPAFIGDN